MISNQFTRFFKRNAKIAEGFSFSKYYSQYRCRPNNLYLAKEMKKLFYTLYSISLLAFSSQLYGQATNAPLNQDYYHLLERFEVASGQFSPSFHAAVKAYNRKAIGQFLDSLPENIVKNRRDQFNLDYLKNDNWEWVDSANCRNKKGLFGHIYKTKPDFLNVHNEEFDLHIKPVLYLSYGKESGAEENIYMNTRGVEVRGLINKKVGFYTFIGENQALFPSYINRFNRKYRSIPNEGFYKDFQDGQAFDFFTARGYISFQATKNINLQFGHDRFKIGNGYRSLMLSDFAPSYLFLKASTKIWKLNYTNIFGLQTADVFFSGNSPSGSQDQYPRKFMALHHLSYNITKNLNIGVFEAIMLGDSTRSSAIDINYLNPFIFYRSLEQQDGSTGNALLGADFRWILWKRFSLYGQITLDEFLLEKLREGNGWWGNKYAIQAGAKYFNAFGISNLDLQAEYNVSRPFMYSHKSNYTNYSHYLQPLAHPLGANFKEYLGIMRYQILPKLTMQAKLIRATYGTDTASVNYGGNIFLPNITRHKHAGQGDDGHTIGQGISNTTTFMDLTLTYQPYHNVFLEFNYGNRKQESDLPENNYDEQLFSLGLRWNIPRRENLF